MHLNNQFMTASLCIMHYAYGDVGELEDEMRRAFCGQLKKDTNVKSETVLCYHLYLMLWIVMI